MAGPRLILCLLGAAHMALSFVVWRLAEQQIVGSPPQIWLIALLRAQVTLLALFLALGTAIWWFRLAVLSGCVTAWSFAFWKYAQQPFAETATFFTVSVVPVLLFGAVARWRGIAWERTDQVERAAAGGLGAQQFSLGAAFRWLTVAALLLGLAKQAVFPVAYWHLLVSVALINTAVAASLVGCYLGQSYFLPRLFLVLLTTALLTLLLEEDSRQAWVSKFLLQALLMAGTISICRMAGWSMRRTGVSPRSSQEVGPHSGSC